jgi:hypothetical protein
MYALPHVIKLFGITRQDENVKFLAASIKRYCQCSQCQAELTEEVELLRADWRYIFSVN